MTLAVFLLIVILKPYLAVVLAGIALMPSIFFKTIIRSSPMSDAAVRGEATGRHSHNQAPGI